VLKDSLENRLGKAGYVDGTETDIPYSKRIKKPIRMTLHNNTKRPKTTKRLVGLPFCIIEYF
jgi:hypothetical protein